MRWVMQLTTWSLWVALVALLPIRAAQAFSEDLCWRKDGNGVQACTPLPPECEPVGSSSAACMTRAAALTAAVGSFPHARSSVHTDATHLMAQVAGFSAADAYWIAAYDEAVDLGAYAPVDLAANPIGAGQLDTAVLDGYVRTNFGAGGVFYHFISPRSDGIGPVPVVDGLHPNLEDAITEGFMVHLRAWALAGSGLGRPNCTDGLSSFDGSNYALATNCFARETGLPADINAVISVFGPTAVSFSASTGSQLIVAADQPGGPLYAESFDSVVGSANAANARLGIYLHALADRISHHVCTDRSPLTGPRGLQRSFDVDMSNPDCTQGPHALRHLWEVGVDQSLLAAADRTTAAALGAIYDELLVFAGNRGVLRPQAQLPETRAAVLDELSRALSKADGAQRLDALTLAACSRGLAPFPGASDCLYRSGFE
jgi:hypothetical protein